MKRPFLQTIPFALVYFVLVLSGCGKPTPMPTQTSAGQTQGITSIDACTLLTKADAEQLLGKPVEDPVHPIKSSDPFIVDSCEYIMKGGTAKDHAILTIVLPANGDLKTAQTIFENGKQEAEATYKSTPPDVPGLGDTAYWVGGAGNTLMMMKGGVTVSLTASTQKGDAPSQAMLDTGKLVLERLP